MPKFSGNPVRAAVPSAVRATSTFPDTITHQGSPAFTRDIRGELFVTALTSLVREEKFYESAKTADARLVSLVQAVTSSEPEWILEFAPWLRREGFMRSAPLVIAAEYVRAGGPGGRQLVNAVLRRADEPAELLAYWISTYGRKIPQPIKRGVADAVGRLYNERSVLKYDGSNRAWRFGDVIELVHPKPTADWQSELFKFCLDRRRHLSGVGPALPMIGEALHLEMVPQAGRREVLREDPERLRRAGFTWERLSGWLPGGMDAEAWESIIPTMGYMALLRNLRNFDEAKISNIVAQGIVTLLSDPDEIAKSMQFPFRFYSAWKQAVGLRWATALEYGLEHSTSNVPELPGKTLIIVDVSGSMETTYSKRGTMTPLEAAMIFGAAVFARNQGAGGADLIGAATDSAEIPWQGSILRTTEWVRLRTIGAATYLGRAISKHWQGHDRILLFTDGQIQDQIPPLPVPIYLFNLNAYRPTPLAVGRGGAHELGGLSDATFRLIPLLEMEKAGVWPWEL